MKRQFLEQIILEWEDYIPEKIIKREYNITEPKINRCVSLVGPRRVGKSYIMFQKIKELVTDNILYLNFDHPFLTGCSLKDLMDLLKIYYEIYPERKGKTNYFFLDEIQEIENWEKFVRYLLDTKNKVFVTGSSSKLLSKEIATLLRGRTIQYFIFPLSFKEYLKFIGFENFNNQYSIKKELKTYIYGGGYPEYVLERNKNILFEILSNTIYKDLVERWKIENLKVLKLITVLLANSSFTNITKLYNNISGMNLKVGKTTISNYLEYLEDSFVVFRVKQFSESFKTREIFEFKPFFVDTGLLNLLSCKSDSKYLENIVFIELLRKHKFLENIVEVYYYKTRNGKEIDFLVRSLDKLELYEVCYELDQEHVNKVLKALDELDLKKGMIITWDDEDLIEKNGKRIKVVPLWKWLLGCSFVESSKCLY
jgi:predicted AAA+ superfamily ATPase